VDLRGAHFDHTLIFGTQFDRACLDRASFIRATFTASSIDRSLGRHVDFSRAKGLDRLEAKTSVLTGVRLDGAEGRPARWGPTGTAHPQRMDDDPCR
jgi:uncharacterized protein YjbI with pentapeptide repeats